jgi:hypothetical protein
VWENKNDNWFHAAVRSGLLNSRIEQSMFTRPKCASITAALFIVGFSSWGHIAAHAERAAVEDLRFHPVSVVPGTAFIATFGERILPILNTLMSASERRAAQLMKSYALRLFSLA